MSHDTALKRILQLRQDPRGQWQYRGVDENDKPAYDWQFGNFDLYETIDEAKARFGSIDGQRVLAKNEGGAS
jgi:hypothetical protein|tara:strand:+ start:247 stop:462 length:216 start_codon:yes stop_codon:yes gene_type:complete